jgi:hypothetical protein
VPIKSESEFHVFGLLLELLLRFGACGSSRKFSFLKPIRRCGKMLIRGLSWTAFRWQAFAHHAMHKNLLLIIFCLSALAQRGFALGQAEYVASSGGPGSFALVSQKVAARLCVDTNDFPGVFRAAGDLQTDVARVTGCRPEMTMAADAPLTNLILIGTLGKNSLISRLIAEKKIDVSAIAGQWESLLIQVVPKPWPGVDRVLVICGSDQRGTIYGIYDLSEQIGVSPWYFWADVPPKHHDELFVKAGKFVQGPPAVKYRGIFLNDEAPDLTGWAKEKFGGYNHGFYTNVFELLLRLKANYLWPAMWDNCFNEDDPLNPKLANEYGIVMGTSHVEPMMRADKEWNRAGFAASQWNYEKSAPELGAFWKKGIERNRFYENIITIAMRGKIDTPMSETANIALLEKIVAAQREIIADVYQTNAATVPQLWALYKEVQEYYERGMRVPDDVTLLWCDDNWGNLRKLPAASERKRSGGAGIYYHFDYVGGPRNYKWVNTSPLPKIWEQMNLAQEYGANQIWIVNVGHLQHVALPTEFFLSLARNPERWPKEKLSEFTKLWAEREFDPVYAPQIADIVSRYTKFNGRRKPELLAPDTFSLVNYQEADTVLADWKNIATEAEGIYEKLPADQRAAFFELVLYPVKACANLNELYIAAAKNRLFAAQGRASANYYAAEVKTLFQSDVELAGYYNHTLAGGKWNHIMDQTHIGYIGWQQPTTNIMPYTVNVEIPDTAEMGIAIEGSTNVWPQSSGEAVLPAFDKFNQPARYIDVFNKGKNSFQFSATASAPWILLSKINGLVERDLRLWVAIDWKNAPVGLTDGSVILSSGGTNFVAVKVKLLNPAGIFPPGFVEADGCVSIEAEHFTSKNDTRAARWEKIDDLGRTLSAMTVFPVTAPSVIPPQDSPCLEYKMYLFHSGPVTVEFILSPSLNFVAGRGLRFALSFDDGLPQIVTAVPENFSVGAGDGNGDWGQTVKDSVRKVKGVFSLENPGPHTLKFWMVDPGVVLQKIIVDLGGVKPSYLGPPESSHR